MEDFFLLNLFLKHNIPKIIPMIIIFLEDTFQIL